MKTLWRPIATFASIIGIGAIVFVAVSALMPAGPSQTTISSGINPTPTTRAEPRTEWQVERLEISPVKTLSVPQGALSQPETRLLLPQVSPDSKMILWERYTGESIPCAEKSQTCFYPESELWLYATGSRQWRKLVSSATQGSWSPDGSRVAYLAQAGPGRYDLNWISESGGEQHSIVKDVAWAPPAWVDNEQLLFLNSDRLVNQIQADGKEKRLVSRIKIENTGGPVNFVLSGDSKTLALVSNRQVWLVALDGRFEPRQLFSPEKYLAFSNIVGGMAWSDNGRYLAFTAGELHVLVFDRNGQLVSTLATGRFPNSLAWSPNGTSIALLSETTMENQSRIQTLIANRDGSKVIGHKLG